MVKIELLLLCFLFEYNLSTCCSLFSTDALQVQKYLSTKQNFNSKNENLSEVNSLNQALGCRYKLHLAFTIVLSKWEGEIYAAQGIIEQI